MLVSRSDEAEEKCSPSPTRKRVTFDSEVKTYEHIVLQESVELLEEKKEEVKSDERYKNCRESDDEVEEDELDCDESDLDDDEEYYSDDGSSEDKLHKLTKEVYTEEIEDDTEEIDAKLRRSNESVKDGNHYAQGVLNPVENLTQWRSAKSEGRTMQKQSQKENSNLV
ncbi:unnamed protein product [Arabis nemorensis]|uniref:Uncharacterized protein n=1 Tax=Arabis nemorensis TaxID=586526 RepID=A0A565APM3_9BRAS|nr:unnamed protein product [Arabis nemorensis]